MPCTAAAQAYEQSAVCPDDLYLVDAFGVAGSQGSIDFADEGYPQAGVVPFGCVWTARGVLLPGDDPRTDDVEESSHMVWTKAERLTSGRRDPNRIEVHAVKGAGFVVTGQEDPEGLRPGEGEQAAVPLRKRADGRDRNREQTGNREHDEHGASDVTRFDPAFFRHFEQRVGDLRDLGIEADILDFLPELTEAITDM